jgi:hypothetical protein
MTAPVLRAALALAGVLSTARAQQPSYTAATLHCSRWAESSRSQIETATERRSSDASAGREGVLVMRARDTTGGVSLEAWYDSLAVWRRSGGAEFTPDTDGLLGGRYRGILERRGRYTAMAKPFVPDEIAEVAELAGALDDLFPPLPPGPLAPGETWRNSEQEIRRHADTVVSGRALRRFAATAHRERRETVPRGDTAAVPLRQTITEEGEFTWDAAAGLVRRTRTILVETSIPVGGRIRQPVRSRVVQRVELTRLPGRTCS